MPGRVFVRKSVTPVDSLVVELDDPAENERSRLNATDLGPSERYWVCEVGNQAMGSGSMVVVSPLGSIDDDGIAARTRVSESGLSEF